MHHLKLNPKDGFDGSSMAYPCGSNIDNVKGYVQSAIEQYGTIHEQLAASKTTGKINLFCRGSSGAIIAALFAAFSPYECQIVHIKKSGEYAHSNALAETSIDNINIIIDDFICSGDTLYEIYNAIQQSKNPFVQIDVLIVTTGWSTNISEKVGFIPHYVIHSHRR